MQEQEKWSDERRPLHLPKISHRKAKTGKKKAAKAEAAAEAAPGETPPKA
jgi:hypothetical protein